MLNYCNCGGEVQLNHKGKRWYVVCNDCGKTYLLKSDNRVDAVREWNGCLPCKTKDAVTSSLSTYTDGYAVLQLPVENDKTFRGLDDIHGNVELDDYAVVYASALPEFDPDHTYRTLEMLFETLNIARPADYKARSLSVSDIVAVKHDNVISYYFCDRVGFRLVFLLFL